MSDVFILFLCFFLCVSRILKLFQINRKMNELLSNVHHSNSPNSPWNSLIHFHLFVFQFKLFFLLQFYHINYFFTQKARRRVSFSRWKDYKTSRPITVCDVRINVAKAKQNKRIFQSKCVSGHCFPLLKRCWLLR